MNSNLSSFISNPPVSTPTEWGKGEGGGLWGGGYSLRAITQQFHSYFSFFPQYGHRYIIIKVTCLSGLSNTTDPRVYFVSKNPGTIILYSSFRGMELHQAAICNPDAFQGPVKEYIPRAPRLLDTSSAEREFQLAPLISFLLM